MEHQASGKSIPNPKTTSTLKVTCFTFFWDVAGLEGPGPISTSLAQHCAPIIYLTTSAVNRQPRPPPHPPSPSCSSYHRRPLPHPPTHVMLPPKLSPPRCISHFMMPATPQPLGCSSPYMLPVISGWRLWHPPLSASLSQSLPTPLAPAVVSTVLSTTVTSCLNCLERRRAPAILPHLPPPSSKRRYISSTPALPNNSTLSHSSLGDVVAAIACRGISGAHRRCPCMFPGRIDLPRGNSIFPGGRMCQPR